MEDAPRGAVLRGSPRTAHGPHIYPLYVTLHEPPSGSVAGSGGQPSLHFLDEPGEGRAVQDSFPGWGPASARDEQWPVFGREDGSSGP